MIPIPTPPLYCYPPLTVRQCEAVKRALAMVIRAEEAEADRELLVQSLGSITETVDRTLVRGPDYPPEPR